MGNWELREHKLMLMLICLIRLPVPPIMKKIKEVTCLKINYT
jgi:hypothetical protein